MEARLIYLEHTFPPGVTNRQTWSIANGTGVPISQAHIQTTPPPLFTGDGNRRALIGYLTVAMAEGGLAVVKPGWSQWFVGNRLKYSMYTNH